MYQVYCDGITLHDLRSEQLVLTSPVVNLGDNDAGSFEFTIAPTHPEYNSIRKLKSEIQVFHNGIEIFCGRPIEETKDFYDNKKIYCEGELNYLADSIQRPAEYHQMTVRGFLERLVTIHNEQVEESKQFKVGMVTVVDSNDSLYRYTNYESTLTCISDKLIKKLGGHVRVRKVDGVKYIDYLADYPNTNDQVIEFGKNLLDFSQNIDGSDIATAIIPLGGKLEESSIAALEERLTIASVNGGVDFIYNQTAVNNYGWIFKTVTFDDVNVPANLKRKGEQYLEEIQFENLVLSCTAVDLNNLDVDIERIKILDRVRVVSEPHGLDRFFPVTKLTINLEQPESDKITLGSEDDTKTSLTGSSASNNSDIMDRIQSIPSEADILKEAQDNATELIKNATHGHVVTEPDELLIMDTNNKESAGRLWRWNLNGLGYSSTGYNGRYTTAITMDGQIVGERLIGGSVTAEKLAVEYRSSVEKAIQLAEDNANDATDQKLKSYYTKVQVTTEIKNSADSVLISAKEEAKEYTDSRLKNYSTSAQIKVTTDRIENTVSQKLNTSDFTTKLTQSSYYVRIAWNNCSQYIQFEGSQLNIYDYSDYKLMSLNSTGCWYYRDGTTIGKIGTNSWSGTPSYRGLVFDLEYNASYMCWAAKDSTNASSYVVKLIYHHKTSKEKQGLHFGCNTYANGNLYLTDNYRIYQYSDGAVGYDGKFMMNGGLGISGRSEFYLSGNTRMAIYNGVTVDFYSPIDMHGWSINNQSDARMKKNIHSTSVNALKILNGIDLKEFDWVQSGEHERIGIIAQQLEQIAPELVQQEQDGHLSIKTTKFIFYLIKAIQELSGDGYEKIPWSDPYSLKDKLEFCAKLGATNYEHKAEKKVFVPIQIPIRK
jgi:hypothetical protein